MAAYDTGAIHFGSDADGLGGKFTAGKLDCADSYPDAGTDDTAAPDDAAASADYPAGDTAAVAHRTTAACSYSNTYTAGLFYRESDTCPCNRDVGTCNPHDSRNAVFSR